MTVKLTLPSLRTPVKKALSIGIRYQGLKDKDGRSLELEGTHRDPPAIQRLLTHVFGYKNENITILMDDGKHTPPTRENIVRAMKDLVHDAQPGDHFVFHYSGHGSQVEAVDDLSEEDGMDEVIWPMDIGGVEEDDVNNYIVDNDIREILVNHLPSETRLVMIFDCCNSGTAADLEDCSNDLCPMTPIVPPVPAITTTTLSGSGILGNNGLATAYMAVKREDGEEIHEAQIDSPVMTTTAKYPGTLNRNEPYVVSWSACKDGQVTFEADYGLFVRVFTRSLRRKPHQTHQELLQSLIHELQNITTEANRSRAPNEEEYQPPRPQLGSLRKVDDLFHATFFL